MRFINIIFLFIIQFSLFLGSIATLEGVEAAYKTNSDNAVIERIQENSQFILQNKKEKLKQKGITIEQSVDLGGHGGTFSASISINGKISYLFLKPKDSVEAGNYKVIQLLDFDLAYYMPKIYGEVKIGDNEYLVMENTRLSPNGISLQQLVDIKLAGKVPGEKFNFITGQGFNPIASKEEIEVTRGKPKSYFDFIQMGIGAYSAPDYMIASGPKALRVINYQNSEKLLKSSLKDIPPQYLINLCYELDRLNKTLQNSDVVFIGASIILVKQLDGSVKPFLIDPAHMQVYLDFKNLIDNNLPAEISRKIYYGNASTYMRQKNSNQIAIDRIILTIRNYLKEK